MNKQKVNALIKSMKDWADGTRSLAQLQERMGNHDARTAMIGAVLTVEGWIVQLKKL